MITSLFLKKERFYSFLFLLLSFLYSAQNVLVGTGFNASWPPACNNVTPGTYFSAGAGTSYTSGTLTANGTGDQFWRLGIDWSGSVYQVNNGSSTDAAVVPNTTYTANLVCTSTGALKYNVANTAYKYVFKTKNAGVTPSGDWVFFEVQGAVQSVSSVTRSPSTVPASMPVTVTATTSGTVNTGQAVYLRYTTNAWSTSTVVQMTGTGTTYTASIPAQSASTSVQYYVFTSGTANVASNGSNADLYTINLNNNSGSNYSYTVGATAYNVWVTSTAGTSSAGYSTLKGAIDAINAGTHTGAIEVAINSSTSETATSVLNSSGAESASYTSVRIYPSADGLTVSGASATGRGLIELNGADNVTIDGDNPNTSGTNRNLTITNTASNTLTYSMTIRIAVDATTATTANSNTIKNCIINGNASGRNVSTATSTSASENLSYGIYAGNRNVITAGTNAPGAISSTTTVIGSGATYSNLIIDNNQINSCARAIMIQGSAATVATGLLISNNLIGASTAGASTNVYSYGIGVQGSSNGIVRGNIIQNVESYLPTSIRAISIGDISSVSGDNFTVENNKIGNVINRNTGGWSAYGINVSGGTSNVIRNNFIYAINSVFNNSAAGTTFGIRAIRITSGTGHKIYHNSINLSGATLSGAAAADVASCLTVTSSTVTGLDVRNNIFSNVMTGAFSGSTVTCLQLPSGLSSTFAMTLNNNAYYSAATILSTTDGTTVANTYTVSGFSASATTPAANPRAYTTTIGSTSNDNASYASTNAAPFTSATDLHLNSGSSEITNVEGKGANLGVTTDIDGDSRGTTPDMGADEISVSVCSTPTSLAATATVSATGLTTISGSFTAAGSPVPTGYIVVRSTSNALPTLTDATTYTVGANTAIAANGYVEYVGTSAGSWTSTGLSANTTYYYFVFSYNNTSCTGGPKYSTTAKTANATTSSCVAFSSTISIGGSTTTVGSQYPTLTAAIADLSACSISQPTLLSINSSYTSSSETFPIIIPNITGSSTTNTVTIKPASGVTTSISGASASNAIIRINGGSNVIIDGSNTVGGTSKDLSITNTSATSPNAVLIGSPNTTPVSNVILKNTVITNGANTSSAVLVGSSAAAFGPGYFSNITIQNNTISKAYVGIFVSGNTAAGNGDGLLIDNNILNSSGANSIRVTGIYVAGVDGNSTISNNTIGNISNTNSESVNGIWAGTGTNKATVIGNIISGVASTISGTYTASGIYISSGATAAAINVNNNTISNVSSLATYADGTAGIEVGGATTNVSIYSNKISNIKNNNTSGYGSGGIFLASSSTSANISVYNNMIWDVAAYGNTTVWRNGFGISFIDGAGYRVYYNSVNMATNQTVAGVSAALYVDSSLATANGLDIRNNIFNNAQTTGTRYAFYSGAANTVYSNINYNDYYSTGSVGYLTSARATLANWQTATGKDANSLNVLPPFLSATDLHLSTCGLTLESKGTPIAGITTDIDSDTRNSSTPDIGADEIDGIAPPTIASVVNGNSCGSGAVVLTANGATAGPAITGYNWYSASTGGTLIGTSSTSNWTTPSISATTNYYVAAVIGTCESTTRTLVTANIYSAPTDIASITQTDKSSVTIASACDVDYVELKANGGIVTTIVLSGTATGTSTGSSTGSALGPNPLQNYYGGSKQQWIYRAAELSALGLSAGSKIKSIKLDLATADNTYTLQNLRVKMKNSATTAFSSATAGWESGMTTVRNAANYTPAVNLNTIVLDTPFEWDGANSLVIEINYSNNNTGTSGTTYNTAKYSTTSFVSTIFYRNDTETAATIDGYTSTAGARSFSYSSRNDVTFEFENQKVTWLPAAGLYTDTALTIPYNGMDNLATVYAAPGTATVYTAKSTNGTCEKTNVTTSIVRVKNQYVGAGTDWNTASNWFPNVVPDANKCANIPAGKTVVIGSDALAKTVTIASTGKLTINANKSLTVTDGINITNNLANDNLVMESDASLMQINDVSNSGKIYVKRDVKMRKMDYTFWSAPVSGQVLRNTSSSVGSTNPALYDMGGFSEGTPNNRIYRYNEPNDLFVATTDANFVSGKAYAIRGKDGYYSGTDPLILTSDNTLKFIGVPNNGNSITASIQKSKNTGTGGSVEHGYNMIGNPYPSNLDFISFYNFDQGGGVYNRSHIYGKAWFWTNTSPVLNQSGSNYSGSNYAVLSLAGSVAATGVDSGATTGSPLPTEYIKVGQGFIVQMKGTAPTGTTPNTATLKFDNSMRSNATGVFYNNNKAENQKDRYWLKLVSPENISNMILLAHLAETTNNYDADYDADLLTVGDDSFYSKLNTQKLQIQSRSAFNDGDVIPLGVKYSMNGSYKIMLSDKEGVFSSGQKIYLHDKLSNTYTDLTQENYNFQGSKGLDETRFEIVYKKNDVLGTGSSSKSEFVVYKDGSDYVIKSSKSLGKVEMFDAAGKLIKQFQTKSFTEKINMNGLVEGVYILKVENSGELKTHKIIK